jgi:hypothetical protein
MARQVIRPALAVLLLAALAGCTRATPPPAYSRKPPALSATAGGYQPGLTLAYGAYQTTVPGVGVDVCYWERIGVDLKTRNGNGYGDGGETITVHITTADAWFYSEGCGTWHLIS